MKIILIALLPFYLLTGCVKEKGEHQPISAIQAIDENGFSQKHGPTEVSQIAGELQKMNEQITIEIDESSSAKFLPQFKSLSKEVGAHLSKTTEGRIEEQILLDNIVSDLSRMNAQTVAIIEDQIVR